MLRASLSLAALTVALICAASLIAAAATYLYWVLVLGNWE